MTFHDPASIESGCVYTRGRDHETHKREMYLNNFLFWVTILGLQTLCCYAAPEDMSNVNITTINSYDNKSLNIDIKNSAKIEETDKKNSSIFLDIPKHINTTLGESVLLECRTKEPVIDCQWSWRPFPPVHLPLPDINPIDNVNDTTTTRVIDTVTPSSSSATTTTATISPSLPVRLFPAFGNNSNDCSVRFTDIQHEQIGYWTCAVRQKINQSFVSTEPAIINIVEKPEISVVFLKTENATEAPGGSSAEIICRTEKPVKNCKWLWRMFNQTEEHNLEVKKFTSFGMDNTDCSLKFKNVLTEQEGLWTCGAQVNDNTSYVLANPIRFLVSEVEFVQLRSGIQTPVGESALLICLVDKPVIQCEWSWRPINSSREPTVIKKFVPNSDNEHDCSVRFNNVLYEEEGLWTCGVRLTKNGNLHEAPPAKLTLLPSGKISFVELPENKSALVNSPETLKCLMNGKVDKCAWLWRPLTGDSEATVAREFPAIEKNCSLNFTHVQMDNQGYWACRVTILSSNTILTSPFIKLIVSNNQEKIEFSELSQNINVSSGGNVSLRCVTTLSVEQCRWSLTPLNLNTTVVVKQFPAVGLDARDCSVKLSHALAEQEGLWTCGAKIHGKENYTNAPPAKLRLLEPEAVAVALWTNIHQRVTLACRLDPMPENAKCQWIHEAADKDSRTNSLRRSRQEFQMNYTSGLCTLQFKPIPSDFGSWICLFNISTDDGPIELGKVSLILLNTQTEEEWLSWVVGAATTLVLFFLILVVVLVVFRGKLFYRAELHMLETMPFESTKPKDRKNSQENRSSKPVKSEPTTSSSSSPDDTGSHTNPAFHDISPTHHPRVYETFNSS